MTHQKYKSISDIGKKIQDDARSLFLFWCRKIEAHWKDVDEDENLEDQNRSEAGSEDFNFPRLLKKTTCGGERGWIDLVNIAAHFFDLKPLKANMTLVV